MPGSEQSADGPAGRRESEDGVVGFVARRVVPLAVWCYLVWVLLAWTLTLEQLVFGAVVALCVAVALAPLGPVPGPWRLLVPANALACARLVGAAARRIVVANVRLAVRIWAPSRPLRSGMLIVPTASQTDGALTAVGLISSLIVDNQIVDLDRGAGELQYHAVAVPEGGPRAAQAAITRPIEDRLPPGLAAPASAADEAGGRADDSADADVAAGDRRDSRRPK